MSIEQYQRTVNALDKDIADLEKKKAALDKKAAEEQRKAANITINKNASTATVRSKLQQRDNYLAAANKASGESATLASSKPLLTNIKSNAIIAIYFFIFLYHSYSLLILQM